MDRWGALVRENRFLQWCKWRRLEVPTGPWIGCPRPLANFPKAFAPVQWATCQRLLCGYACSSVREHSASVRVGLFQRPASTRSRTRMPSRASSLGDCQRWTLASSSCLAQHPPWSTATAAKRRFKKALAVTTHHHPLASPRRWRRGARQAQRPPARLLHRSPAACSPGFPWPWAPISVITFLIRFSFRGGSHAAGPDVRFVRHRCRWCVSPWQAFQPHLCLVA